MKSFLSLKVVQFTSCVVNSLASFKQLKVISTLVIAPHPDDEIIGLGGFILEQIKSGNKVHILYLTDGEGSAASTDLRAIKSQRIAMTQSVQERLGLTESEISYLHIEDGAVPRCGEEGFESNAQLISALIDKIKPDAVFATSATDYWPYDHVACSELAVAAVKQSTSKPALWFYWVWSWYNLRPKSLFKLNFKNIYKIDITGQLSAKKELMDIYLKPVSPEGKPWSGELPKAMLYPFSKPVEIVERYVMTKKEMIK